MAKLDPKHVSYWDGMQERDLQVIIAQHTMENGKYLKSINNTLNWFFWIFIIGLVIWIIGGILSHQPTPVPVSPY